MKIRLRIGNRRLTGTDGEKIPNPGIMVIGKLDSGHAFNEPGSAEVKIEVMHE